MTYTGKRRHRDAERQPLPRRGEQPVRKRHRRGCARLNRAPPANLSKAVSGVSWPETLSADAVTTVTFTSDIDWENGTLSYYSDKYGSSGDTSASSRWKTKTFSARPASQAA
jgi:hypothetical protein